MTQPDNSPRDQRRFVQRMFAEIVPRYDLLNRLLTLGMDIRWRRRLVAGFWLQPDDRVLDLACGTGDIARQLGRRWPACWIIGADPVPEMLSRASKKFPPLTAVCCEGEALPFLEGSFQVVTVAFGLRNFSSLEAGLQEIRRVLVSGGQLGILEFALPDQGVLRGLYRWYLGSVLPRLGAFLSKGYAYRYLPESIESFPAPALLSSILDSIGFSQLSNRFFLGGTVRIYWVVKK